MNDSETWLDRLVSRICEWFDDIFPGGHPMVAVGNGLAGLRPALPMPVDRTWRPRTVMFNMGNVGEQADKAHIKSGVPLPETSCNFWAYCHISGNLCVWCGGKNSLGPGNEKHQDFVKAGKDLCPSGAAPGAAWFGCCRNPTTKVAKYIAFMDCCGLNVNDCGPDKEECEKWPAAKDWCAPSAKEYYCTVVIDFKNDKGCQ